MVKGISRQVIVVRQPDTKLFDQAIFLLRDDAIGDTGVTDQQLLQEANQAASTYLDHTLHPRALGKRLRSVLYLGLGAGITGAVWLLTAVLL